MQLFVGGFDALEVGLDHIDRAEPAIAHEPGGPGRVFLLDENDVVDRLTALNDVTGGVLRWSETAGLKQVVRDVDLNLDIALRYVDMDYAGTSGQEAA